VGFMKNQSLMPSGSGGSMFTCELGTFFDATELMKGVDKAEKKALSRAGAFVRKRARGSIRRRKTVSRPGRPPNAHLDDLKRILFAYDKSAGSVVIGPMPLNGRDFPKVPTLLEFGGNVRSYIRTKSGRRSKHVRRGRKTLRYRARPFMGPAMDKELAKGTIPKQFENAVHVST
jgi:hypothetical protein